MTPSFQPSDFLVEPLRVSSVCSEELKGPAVGQRVPSSSQAHCTSSFVPHFFWLASEPPPPRESLTHNEHTCGPDSRAGPPQSILAMCHLDGSTRAGPAPLARAPLTVPLSIGAPSLSQDSF